MEKEDGQSKYFFMTIIIIAVALSLMIIFPFLTSIVIGGILAYIFHPLYNWIQKKIKYKGISAFITTIIILLIVAIPAFLLVTNITQETSYIYVRAKQHLASGEIIETRCYDEGLLCKTITDVNELVKKESVKQYLLNRLNDLLTFVTKKVSSIILSIPKLVINTLLILFTIYYALKDGKEFMQRAAKVAPLKVHHQEEIFKQFNDVTFAVIYGSFIVAAIQGALGAFGFWLFGIKGFLIWGAMMTFFALIPFIGTWVVWFPASLMIGITGYLQGETAIVWKGAGLFLYGLLIISTVDNILKPILVAGRTKVHPLLILIGILGGLFAFGFIGLLIGPLLLAILQTLLGIYEKERQPHAGTGACILGRNNNKHKK